MCGNEKKKKLNGLQGTSNENLITAETFSFLAKRPVNFSCGWFLD